MVTCSGLLSSPELLPPAESVTLAVGAENVSGRGGAAVVLRLLADSFGGPSFGQDIYTGLPLAAGHGEVAECARVRAEDAGQLVRMQLTCRKKPSPDLILCIKFQASDPVVYTVEDVSPSSLFNYFSVDNSTGVVSCLEVEEGDEEAERASLEGGKATVVVRAENSRGEDLAAIVFR